RCDPCGRRGRLTSRHFSTGHGNRRRVTRQSTQGGPTMGKRNLVLGLLIAVTAGILAGSVAMAATRHHGGDKDKGKGHARKAIVVVERATTDTLIDNGADGDSIGDLLAFCNEVFDKTNTKKVGTDQGSCVRTVPGTAFEC